MASEKRTKPVRRSKPAATPEARENQLIALAVSLAEKQMEEGTASAQVISHYLKMGSTRERLEQRRLDSDVKLLEAKIEQLSSANRMEELYANAITAMNTYSGRDDPDEDDDYE